MYNKMFRASVEVTIEDAAKCFAGAFADEQAEFFRLVAEISEQWVKDGKNPDSQWCEIGEHMRNPRNLEARRYKWARLPDPKYRDAAQMISAWNGHINGDES